MSRTVFLQAAYLANIVILVPVCWAMLSGPTTGGVFEGKVAESDGLRLLVGSLWTAILIASIAGLVWPLVFAPLLLVQIVYKALWLALFILPLVRAGEAYPAGITAVFVAIVLSYPFLFWFGTRA